MASGSVYALAGGNTVQGHAIITPTTPNLTTINQTTERAAINWNNFNIEAHHGVQLNQPNANSATLMIITGANAGPTTIAGSLSAKGRVVIVDPNGVVFAHGAVVNVGSLMATTKDIDKTKFMSGANALSFMPGNTAPGLVKVEAGAKISAKEFVVLLGRTVDNEGHITAGTDTNAKNRGIALVGAGAATVHLDKWDVTIDQPAMDALVKNFGELTIGESQSDGSIVLNATGKAGLMHALLSSGGKVLNNSHGQNSITSLDSTGELSHTGDIEALAGNVALQGVAVTIGVGCSNPICQENEKIHGGDIRVGDTNTTSTVSVGIKGNTVAQKLSSTIVAESGVGGKISIATKDTADLAGKLLAPGGQISLASRMIDITQMTHDEKIFKVDGRLVKRSKVDTKNGDENVIFYDYAEGIFYKLNGKRVEDGTPVKFREDRGSVDSSYPNYRVIEVKGHQYVVGEAGGSGSLVINPFLSLDKQNSVLATTFGFNARENKKSNVLCQVAYVSGRLFLREARSGGPFGEAYDPKKTLDAILPIEVDHVNLEKSNGEVHLAGGVMLTNIISIHDRVIDMTLRDRDGKTWTSSLPLRFHRGLNNHVAFTKVNGEILLAEERNGVPFGHDPLNTHDKNSWAKSIGIHHWDGNGLGVREDGKPLAIDGVVIKHGSHKVESDKVYAKLLVKADGNLDKIIAVDEHGKAISDPLMNAYEEPLSATENPYPAPVSLPHASSVNSTPHIGNI